MERTRHPKVNARDYFTLTAYGKIIKMSCVWEGGFGGKWGLCHPHCLRVSIKECKCFGGVLNPSKNSLGLFFFLLNSLKLGGFAISKQDEGFFSLPPLFSSLLPKALSSRPLTSPLLQLANKV